jgi:hypothetical protein
LHLDTAKKKDSRSMLRGKERFGRCDCIMRRGLHLGLLMRRDIEVRLRWITLTLLLLCARLKITDQIKRSLSSTHLLFLPHLKLFILLKIILMSKLIFLINSIFFVRFVFSLSFIRVGPQSHNFRYAFKRQARSTLLSTI